MHLEKLFVHDHLAKWCKQHCPPSFVYRRRSEGYGYSDYLCLPKGRWQVFWTRIAEITGTTITVFHPNYLSDIEDLMRSYEAATGQEVTIKYFEEV